MPDAMDNIFDSPGSSNGESSSLDVFTPKPPTHSPPKKAPPRDEVSLDLWRQWKATPTPDRTGALLQQLRPDIDRAISAHLGQGASNPVLLGRARRMALDALPRYEPEQASLSTYLVSQLAGLRRFQRKQTQSLRVPERVGFQNAKLLAAEGELEAELGRPPSEREIAQRTGIPLPRLAQIRRQALGERPEGSFVSPEGGTWNPAVQTQTSKLWAELVHEDLQPTNQFILEHTVGLFDKPVLSNQEIARRLKLTPGAISQRRAVIQALLDKELGLSPFGGEG
jgi:hypothetical protein